MRSLRSWQKYLEGIEIDALAPELVELQEETPDSHEHVEDYEIVEPPTEGEDLEQAHGGDDSTQDVEDAPEREEAAGENPDGEQEETDPFEKQGSEEEDTDQDGEYQHQQVFTPDLAALRERRLSNALATIIGKVAEDLSGWPVEGDDEWDTRALMERRITRRPLGQCRQSRERERVVLILDTSGSCYRQAAFFSSIASAALRLGDVEIYTAPNGELEYRNNGNGWEKTENYQWHFKGRTIIFFGDFDGGDYPVEASRRNKVYWFSCEDRYTDMDEHNWCSYTLSDFRGKYYICETEEDFLRLMKKVR